jgi:hypothetical protein
MDDLVDGNSRAAHGTLFLYKKEKKASHSACGVVEEGAQYTRGSNSSKEMKNPSPAVCRGGVECVIYHGDSTSKS